MAAVSSSTVTSTTVTTVTTSTVRGSPASVRRSTLLPTLGAEKQAVVLDFGTAYTKCGFSGEPTPRHILRSVVTLADGSEVPILRWAETRSAEELKEALARFLFDVFYKHLLVKAADRRIVVCESLLTPTVFRNALADVLFRNFQVMSVLFAPLSVLSLLPLAIETALVVDIGHEETSVIAVSEGIPLIKTLVTVPYAGKALQKRVSDQIMKHARAWQGGDLRPVVSLTSHLPDSVLEDIAVRTCIVAGRGDNRKATVVSYPFEGIRLELDHAVRVQSTNVLFEDDEEGESIPAAILSSLSKCPVDIRKALIGNISLIGGTAALPGLKPRLVADLRAMLSSNRFPTLREQENRVIAVEATLKQTDGDFGKLTFYTDTETIQKALCDRLGCAPQQFVDFSISEADGCITARIGVLDDVDVDPLVGLGIEGQRQYIVEAATKSASDMLSSLAVHDSVFPSNTMGWLGGALFGALDFLGEKSVLREHYLRDPAIPDWNNSVAAVPAPAVDVPVTTLTQNRRSQLRMSMSSAPTSSTA